MRVMLYWGVITLVPIVLVGALGLTTGPHWQSTKDLLYRAPWLVTILFRILPLVVICLTFSLFYMLMPNTKVHWQSALIGGLVGGGLFHFNNLISVLYVSRVVSNSRMRFGSNFGLAIGVINYARSLHGMQLGLLNIVRDNPGGRKVLPVVNWHFQ